MVYLNVFNVFQAGVKGLNAVYLELVLLNPTACCTTHN